MKKFILSIVMICALSTSVFAENWELFCEKESPNHSYSGYIDLDSIHREGKMFSFTGRAVISVGDINVLDIANYLIDCSDAKLWRVEKAARINLSTGKLVDKSTEPSKWIPIRPNTCADILWQEMNQVCKSASVVK